MTVNLATKYSSKLDQVFTHDSYTEAYINKKYDFDGVKTVNVYTVTTVAPSNYSRTDTGDRFGGNNELQDIYTPYTLDNDKSFKIVIDRGNYEQQALAKKAGEVLRAEMNEQVIPMIDKNRLAAAATGAAAAGQAIAAGSNAYYDIAKANAYLDEAKAPLEGRVIMVTPGYYNAIKAQITTTLRASGYSSDLVKKGFVGELDGVPVVKVPTSYFPANTNCLIWHRDALLGAKQVTHTRIITDSELVDGTILLGRFIFGSWVLKGKEKAVASITGAYVSL